jgi:hypothetical protein
MIGTSGLSETHVKHFIDVAANLCHAVLDLGICSTGSPVQTRPLPKWHDPQNLWTAHSCTNAAQLAPALNDTGHARAGAQHRQRRRASGNFYETNRVIGVPPMCEPPSDSARTAAVAFSG